jgi:nicotinamide riboside kinase
MRVAILGAPATGKKALLNDLQSSASGRPNWQLHRDAAAVQTLEWQMLQAPDETTRQHAIAAHVLQPIAADLILLSALDYPTLATGSGLLQRRLLDQSLRQALTHLGLRYSLLYGNDAARYHAAMQAIDFALQGPTAMPLTPMTPSFWRWSCEKCSDPDCEHRLFSALLQPS